MQPLIRLADVSVSRNGRRLLGPVSWRLNPGTHTALVGANGAGKTTLLRLLRGETQPDPGGERVYDFGDGPQRTPLGLRQRIGHVSADMQDFYLLHGRRVTVRETVLAGFFGTPMLYEPPAPAQEDAADRTLADLGLAGLADRRMGGLSTGQVRATLLARALAATPDVLLLDECFEGLDAPSRRRMRELLDMAAERTALVFAAHRLEDAPGCIDRVAVLEDGRIVCKGGRAELAVRLSDPAAPPTACETAPVAAEPMEFLVRMRNVSVVKGGTRILSDVNWEVLPGERWLVTGANGAGKSTLLGVITSEESPYADGEQGVGVVERLGGLTMDAARPRIGVVSPALQTRYGREMERDVTVMETTLSGFLGSVGLLESPSEEQRRLAAQWLGRLGLIDRADDALRTLSYGQQRRVFLARAMAPGPDLLLLDEPFAGLDPASRVGLRGAVRALGAAGASFILATHHAEDRAAGCNRFLEVDDGRIAVCGHTADFGGGDAENICPQKTQMS